MKRNYSTPTMVGVNNGLLMRTKFTIGTLVVNIIRMVIKKNYRRKEGFHKKKKLQRIMKMIEELKAIVIIVERVIT